MLIRLEEYVKHSALNLGQALQGLRFLLTHPDIDSTARPGTLRHVVLALPLRLTRVCNDLFYAALPPHWHHSREELTVLRGLSTRHWFQCGYSPYRFTESGERRTDMHTLSDPRWDPRCKDAQ